MKILGIKVDELDINSASKIIRTFLKSKEIGCFTIVTPNPEIIIQSRDDKKLRRIINRADMAIPDGVGLKLAGVKEIIPGVKLMDELCRVAAEKGWRVGLYGGGSAEVALRELKMKYIGLMGWSQRAPHIEVRSENLEIRRRNTKDRRQSFEDRRQKTEVKDEIGWVVEKIKKEKTKLVFVGLGAPKQERFMEILRKELRTTDYRLPIILMTVGGSFDELSGMVRGAPEIIGKMGLKWLWRLIWEPWRIRRQMRLFRFVYLVLRKGYGS